MQWGPTGAAAQVQGLSGTGGHRWWDGCQGLGFRAEFWVLRRKPLVATCEGEEWFGLVEPQSQREGQGELLARCVPLGGAVGLAIKAAEHFPDRFVWSEGLM